MNCAGVNSNITTMARLTIIMMHYADAESVTFLPGGKRKLELIQLTSIQKSIEGCGVSTFMTESGLSSRHQRVSAAKSVSDGWAGQAGQAGKVKAVLAQDSSAATVT